MESENEFEERLRSLIPARSSADPIAAAFEAGSRSGRRRTRIWQMTSLAAALLAGIQLLHPAEFSHVRSPLVRPAQTAAISLTDESELPMARAVLDHGIDALPSPDTMTIQKSDPTNPL